MVPRLVSDALWRNRWGYAVIGLLLMHVWLLFSIGDFNPLPIGFAAISLIATALLGPAFALGAMGLRELRHLPVTTRDLWRTTWIVATVVCCGFLFITKALIFLAVTAFGGTPQVLPEAILLSTVYDFAWAGAVLWTVPSIGLLTHVAEGRGTLTGLLAGAAPIAMLLAGAALPILATDALPTRVSEFTPATMAMLIAGLAIAFRAMAWTPTRGAMAGERAQAGGVRGAIIRHAATRTRYVDHLTGISRVAVPHLTATFTLGILACLAMAAYGAISGLGPWWFVPPTSRAFEAGEDHGLAYFVLLPCMVMVGLGIWMPWARLLKVLPLSARQVNALLVITPFATWTILWVLGWSAYVVAYGTPQTSLGLGFAAGMAAISALVHAALFRLQGGAGPVSVLIVIGVVLPQVVKMGLRDDAASQIVFALISVTALCAAAVINHRTLTRSTSSSRSYRLPQPPFGISTTPGTR